MSRRYSDLDDLISDLDAQESLSDDPFGIAEFDDDDLAILGSISPDPAHVAHLPSARPSPGARPRSYL
jgi:hypothetical protein